MLSKPLVSIIIPTKNSGRFLENCLRSLKRQTYCKTEIIVVDNFSADETAVIAGRFTDKFYQKGPERSAQRNFGAKKAKGEYLFFVDSDMTVSPEVVAKCVRLLQKHKNTVGIVIPEVSQGEGFWAQCLALEKSFYQGVSWMEAARFYRREIFEKVGGYEEKLVAGEDWDLSQRVEKSGELGRVTGVIYHHEGRPSLLSILRKKVYYASGINGRWPRKQADIFARYRLFLRSPGKLFREPAVGSGLLVLKTLEFLTGGVAYACKSFHRY